MGSIQLKCQHCGRTVTVDERHAGRRVRCPGCQNVLQTPTAEQITAAHAPAAPAAAPPSPPAAAPPRAGRLARSVIAAIAERAMRDPDEIQNDTKLVEDLEFEREEFEYLLHDIEEACGITLPHHYAPPGIKFEGPEVIGEITVQELLRELTKYRRE